MGITIHGPAFSTCVARVLAALFEKNVDDYEVINIDLMKGEQKSPEFLKIQPFGVVPAVTFGENFTIYESRAIVRTIAHKFEGQGTPLYGTTPKDKALVEQWLEVESQNFNGPISALVYQLVFNQMLGKASDAEVVATQLAKFEKVLDVYEKHLATSKYLAGDFFSLADLSHLPYLHYYVVAAKRTDILIHALFLKPGGKTYLLALRGRSGWRW